MELLTVYLVVIACIFLPGFIFIPVMIKHNHTWWVPSCLVVWLACAVVLVHVSKSIMHRYVIDVTPHTTTVCAPVTKYDLKWKWE